MKLYYLMTIKSDDADMIKQKYIRIMKKEYYKYFNAFNNHDQYYCDDFWGGLLYR